ncbi:hypothetical protein ACWGH2_29260 [Streptomyces sp. NPDC054871]
MSAPTVARIRADVSDNFLRALHREDSWQVPAAERTTCPDHLDWRSRCADLHTKAAA